MDDSFVMHIASEQHILAVRHAIRELVNQRLQFNSLERMHVITAVSELVRNIYNYAKEGDVEAKIVLSPAGKKGIRIKFADHGPGILDIEKAMQPKSIREFGKGMGIGLSGSKKLADEFSIESQPGLGTTIIWTRWERYG
ncbi:MAG: ATP-binding protein [candidate division FCPU426 bacterium]